jgi:carboxyl-terminal processing protease
MKSILSILLVSFLGFISTSALADCSTFQCKGFKSDFQMILKNGNDIYCYWDLKKKETQTQYDRLAKITMDRITDQTTMTDFYWMMRNWAGLFHDGHVNFMLSKSGPKVEVAAADIRFELLAPATTQEKLIVSEASPSLGLEIGDEILKVGNFTANEAIEQTLPTTSGSTERMRRFFGARRIIEVLAPIVAINQQIEFQVRRNLSGSINTWTVQVPLRNLIVPQQHTKSSSPLVYSEVLPGNIGYLRIDGFSNTVFALEDAMDQLVNTQSLIIDVRKNGGGDQSGDVVLSRLISRSINRYSVSPRASQLLVWNYPSIGQKKKIRGTDFTVWYPNTVTAERTKRYKGKSVYTLTSANCFSACDTFVSALKTHGLSQVIGDGSGGGTGSPLVFSLPYTKHQFRYSVFRGRTHKKNWIEGVGTLPDFNITSTPEDRAQGIDTTLLKAIELASGKTLTRSEQKKWVTTLGPYQDGQTLNKDPITLEMEQATMQQSFRGSF